MSSRGFGKFVELVFLAACMLGCAVYQVYGYATNTETYETGGFVTVQNSKSPAATSEVNTGSKRSGTYGHHVNCSIGTVASAVVKVFYDDSGHTLKYDKIVLRFYIRFNTLPDATGASIGLIGNYYDSLRTVRLTAAPSRTLQIYNTEDSVVDDTASWTPTPGTWYKFQIEAISGAGNGSMKVYIDDAETLSNSTLTWDDLNWAEYGISVADDNGMIDISMDDAYWDYNASPVNGATTISNMDDTDNVYAQKKDYTLSCAVTDIDGYADVTTIDISFKQAATVRETFRYTEDTNTFSVTTSNAKYELGTGSAATRDGNTITISLNFRAKWAADAEVDVDIQVVSTDAGSLTDTDIVQTDYFDCIPRLVLLDFGANNGSPAAGATVTISGNVRYAADLTTDYPASSSFPPDAEFTSVKAIDDQGTTAYTDSTIVNGVFSSGFTAPSVIRTYTYKAYISMADADYVDGYSVDGRTTTIAPTSAFAVSDLVTQGATYFGIPDFLASFLDMMSHLVAYYANCITLIINGITAVFLVIVGVGTFIFDWLFRILTTMAAITAEVLAIFEGTSTAATGLGNIWTLLSLTTASTLSFVTYMIILLWLESIDIREKRQGGGWTAIMVGDVQIVTYVVGIIFEYTWMVFNFVFNVIINLSGLVPGAPA